MRRQGASLNSVRNRLGFACCGHSGDFAFGYGVGVVSWGRLLKVWLRLYWFVGDDVMS
jgi:hypothetical protein